MRGQGGGLRLRKSALLVSNHQSMASETDSFSASQEIPRIVWNSKVD
jgi:1-acyl-sn-glycerol-3-phosphate acyltransferase